MKRINAKSAKAVRKRTEAKRREYRQVLLSIDVMVFDAFKKACGRDRLKHSSVVEEFMKYYVETAR